MIRGQHQYFWNGATVWRKRRCGKPIMPMALWPAFCPGRSRAFKTNPCTNGDKLNQGTRVDKIWSDEDVARFLRTAPSYLHLAMLLAINTGQRQGDLLRLLWSAYDGKEIKMRQRKTGAYVPIPVSDALKTALDAASRKSPIMLVNSDGKPWSESGFQGAWGKATVRAGIRGVTFHDLRGTAVVTLARAGVMRSRFIRSPGTSRATCRQF